MSKKEPSQLDIKADVQTHQAIIELSEHLDISPSEFIREALSEYIFIIGKQREARL